MAAIIYVYQNGTELKNHPLNGTEYAAGDCFIGSVNGFGVRSQVEAIKNRKAGAQEFNAADVQAAPVMLKIWWGTGAAEWFVFATAEQVANAGATLTEFKANRVGRPLRS